MGDESPDGKDGIGDPLEVSLLQAARKGGIEREEIVKSLPEVFEEAFDSDVKMMATFHEDGDGFLVAVKGAPEPVIEASSHILNPAGTDTLSESGQERWLDISIDMAERGLRVLALAKKETRSIDEAPYRDLTFIGLMGLLDPPRSDVREAIGECQEAGIRVIMVTGDQPMTAKNIGEAVGLIMDDEGDESRIIHGMEMKGLEDLTDDEHRDVIGVPIFARVSPKQKLDLIELHQRSGEVVAMTGDGVNDAPALKKADIGIAMGLRGTQVAREAADMVLKDDSFSTIVVAVRQGRIIFNNIRKFVKYLISCNVAEIMTVFIASLIKDAPLPILPLQILFLNLVTDAFPALALGVGEGDREVMKFPPRDPNEPILTRRLWRGIIGYGFLITLSVLGALALAIIWLKMDNEHAITVSFLTLAMAQLWHVFNMRDSGSGFFRNDITKNPYVWGALVLCIGMLVVAVYTPGLSYVLHVKDPGKEGWLLIIGMSLIPWFVGQVMKSSWKE